MWYLPFSSWKSLSAKGDFFIIMSVKFFLFFYLFAWGGPWPYILFPFRPHFVCKFSNHGDNLSILRPWSQSITVLVFPDFADAYSRTTASYKLTQLSDLIPEISQFLGASKLTLLEWTSLNVGTMIHIYLVSLTPIYACVSYLSAMILLFLDLKGALF